MNVCMLLRGRYERDVRVRKEARALAAAGHEVRVLCRGDADGASTDSTDSSDSTGAAGSIDAVDGVEVRRRPGIDRPGSPGVLLAAGRYLLTGRHPRWAGWLRETLAAWPVDVVHVHDLPLVRTALSVREAVGGLAVVADFHEPYPAAARQWRGPVSAVDPTDVVAVATRLLRPVRRLERLERQALRRADATLAVVEEARQRYLDREAVPGEVHVVSNTVDLERFDALLGRSGQATPSELPDGPVVSYVGTFSGRHRGLETAVDAMAHLDDGHLLLVGAGRREEPLRRRIRERGLVDRVSFTGWVPFDRVPGYMAASEVGIVPHRDTDHTNATVPHKLFQYMAAATPVVVSDARPLERIVEETGAGAVFDAGDPAALADACRSLLADPDRAAADGRRGRAAVESTYSWDRDAGRLRAVYDSLE